MLELKFTIYYRAASLPSQASYAVLAEESQAFSLPAHQQKKKKEKHFGCLATFRYGAFAMLFSAIGCVFRDENTQK